MLSVLQAIHALIISLIAGLSCIYFHQTKIVLSTSFLMTKPHLGKIPSLGLAQKLLQDNETVKWCILTRIITKMTIFFFILNMFKEMYSFPVLFALCFQFSYPALRVLFSYACLWSFPPGSLQTLSCSMLRKIGSELHCVTALPFIRSYNKYDSPNLVLYW